MVSTPVVKVVVVEPQGFDQGVPQHIYKLYDL